MDAWAQGLCLIVYDNSRLAIPEIKHMENVLVGSTAEEVAQMISLAVTNRELNLRLRKGGRGIYGRFFTLGAVAQTLDAEIGRAVSRRREKRS